MFEFMLKRMTSEDQHVDEWQVIVILESMLRLGYHTE